MGIVILIFGTMLLDRDIVQQNYGWAMFDALIVAIAIWRVFGRKKEI